ncbi:hypothetical protein L211DRAFT_834221 [Terfezia boudieri ATCC MYA-4762]|uniref:Nucleolar protein Dnt1-like N-terminal domain-containing protein n=1 Tax=Terfezia boudieri ATCC MYA-4762 TaxID=1051890 RepID=A0A3N4M1U8_9PEZI|nr:hypothetical protein L211DRAFT_834221 [Terfezia boudieri ATCC MYA-4762]
MRLQVLICPTAQGLAEYSFLEITQPTFTLEELAASIEARHTRLYPHQPQLVIHKLQDADSNDLDLEYTVGDVFSDKSKDKSSSVVRVIRSILNRAGSIPPESGLRPQRKRGRERAPLGYQRRGGSHLSHSFTTGDVFDEVMLDEELESGESFQGGERKRHKPMTEDANDEESLDGLSFKQQRRESSVEEVIPESSYIGAENSQVWSTDGHQRPNRRLFARPSSPTHDRNLASFLNKAKGPNTPDFQFTRTRKSAETQVEVLGTQGSQHLPFQEKGTLHPRRLLTNGAPAILSPGSTVDAKEEELTSSASIRSSHSPFLAREAPHPVRPLDDVRSANSMQDTSKPPVLTQAVSPKAHTQSFQQALRHRPSPPLDTPSTQLLIGLALQENSIKSPLSEKTTDQSKLAMERGARAVAAEARGQKQLDTSTTGEDIDDEEDETTDSETEQQMEEELKKVEEKARKVKEDEVRKAKEEEARWEKEEVTRKEQEETRKAKEEETRKEKEELARKAQEEEERKAREEKATKGKEDEEALKKEQQEAEERKAEESSRKAEEAKAAIEAENKKKVAKTAEKEAVEKKKAEAITEKPRKKQEQEELTKIEKEGKAKERAEESERKKQERAKQVEKGNSTRKNAKAPKDAEENSSQNEDTTPKAPDVPASQAGKKRQRPLPNERPLATEDAPQGKKQKTTKAKQANNPEVYDAPLNSDSQLPATPKVVSALRKISPNGTPAARVRRSVSFMDMTASVSTPQNSSASEAPTKVYPKTPVPPPMFILGAEPTLAPAAKRTAKSKTPIPLPDLRATMKVTASNAAPIKTKAVEKKPVAAKGNRSKLSEELVEGSESESDNAQQPSKPVQKVVPPTQDRAEAGTQRKAAAAKDQKETVSQTQEDSDIDMDYVPTNGVAPKAGGRVTRAVIGAVLHEPLPKATRGKKVKEVAPPPLPAFTSKPVHDIWNLSSTSEEDEEGEKEVGRGRAQNILSERAVVVPKANPATKPNTKLSSVSSETESETETTSPNYSESESDDASPPPKPTTRFPSPKAQQIANNLTKALGRTIENNTTTPAASQQIPPSQPVTPFLPPSTQKYKSLSQYAVEEDYPEVTERLSSQTAKKRDAGSDSDDEDEEESSSESENGSDSDSSSGADIIPNTKRAGGAASADKKRSGGRNSLGGFLNRRKSGQSTR